MGYYTTFNGEIELEDKRVWQILKWMHATNQYPFDQEVEEFEFDTENVITFGNIEIKNSDQYIEKLCLFIKALDKKAEGCIGAIGEESDDRWDVCIEKKGIRINRAEMVWKKDRNYIKDEDVVNYAKITLNKPNLNKEILAFAIQESNGENKKEES